MPWIPKGLHAQAKPKAYIVTDIEVLDTAANPVKVLRIFGPENRGSRLILHSGCVGCGSEPGNDELAGAETVFMVERNTCDAEEP